MDAYVIIGAPHARKSSVLRSLTGCANRSIRDILLLPNASMQQQVIQIYARVSSLQESRTSPQDFFQEVQGKGCQFVVFCLWPNANPQDPIAFPDAPTYLNYFRGTGWNIVKIAILGQANINPAVGLLPPDLDFFPNSAVAPINQTAGAVRVHFGWQ